MTFRVFDLPSEPEIPFETRMEHLRTLVESQPTETPLRLVQHIKCNGRDHLQSFHQDITSNGGEGVVLRLPRSTYTSGRSSAFLKYKSTLR